MFVDASAIVAILNEEPEAEAFEAMLGRRGEPPTVSPLARFEAVLSLARARHEQGGDRAEALAHAEAAVDALIRAFEMREVGISPEMGSLALEASRRYGKFVGHQAKLNFGDCFAYACAKTLNAPLLYKGSDFPETDVNARFASLHP